MDYIFIATFTCTLALYYIGIWIADNNERTAEEVQGLREQIAEKTRAFAEEKLSHIRTLNKVHEYHREVTRLLTSNHQENIRKIYEQQTVTQANTYVEIALHEKELRRTHEDALSACSDEYEAKLENMKCKHQERVDQLLQEHRSEVECQREMSDIQLREAIARAEDAEVNCHMAQASCAEDTEEHDRRRATTEEKLKILSMKYKHLIERVKVLRDEKGALVEQITELGLEHATASMEILDLRTHKKAIESCVQTLRIRCSEKNALREEVIARAKAHRDEWLRFIREEKLLGQGKDPWMHNDGTLARCLKVGWS